MMRMDDRVWDFRRLRGRIEPRRRRGRGGGATARVRIDARACRARASGSAPGGSPGSCRRMVMARGRPTTISDNTAHELLTAPDVERVHHFGWTGGPAGVACRCSPPRHACSACSRRVREPPTRAPRARRAGCPRRNPRVLSGRILVGTLASGREPSSWPRPRRRPPLPPGPGTTRAARPTTSSSPSSARSSPRARARNACASPPRASPSSSARDGSRGSRPRASSRRCARPPPGEEEPPATMRTATETTRRRRRR